MIDKQVVESVVSTYLSESLPAYYIVDVAVHPGNRIVVELGADEGVSIDECVRLTKHIESQLDRDVEDYELEVGSAGITSPFKVLRQYEAAVDSEVEVLCKGGIKEQGVLQSAHADGITLRVVRRIKLEGAKRKQDVEQTIEIAMQDILQTKRIIKI